MCPNAWCRSELVRVELESQGIQVAVMLLQEGQLRQEVADLHRHSVG